MATSTSNGGDGAAKDRVERIRELNEQILESARKAGEQYLEVYERTLESIAEGQERFAKGVGVEWISAVVDAQARFTRELLKLSAQTREFLK